jgi:hypothetical protein
VPGHECYHCKQWVDEGEPHDCWTTTEAALTGELSEELQDAYERIRDAAVQLGEQRIYASHSSIMFARKACYFFVRPKRTFLEVCIFLGRTVHAPQVRKTTPVSQVKIAHILRIVHRDEVESPVTDWMKEAYALQDQPPVKPTRKAPARAAKTKNVTRRRSRKVPATTRRGSAKRR